MPSNVLRSDSGIDHALSELKAEHAACVQVISSMAADPAYLDRIAECLTRIDDINHAIIRLASAHTAH